MKRPSFFLLGTALLCGTALAYPVSTPAPSGPLHDLERARPARALAARLSIATEYRPCTALPARKDETVPRERCGEGGGAPAGLETLAAAGESADPDSLQASALLALMKKDATGSSLNEAMTLLIRGRRLSSPSVPLLVDLSAAYLTRAQRTQSARDLAEALDLAGEALSREPRNQGALYNAGLALGGLVLDEQASRVWDMYLAVDSTSPWADEARHRRAGAMSRRPAIREPLHGASDSQVREFVSLHPQEARLLGLDRVLGEWGGAVERGDRARADSLANFVEQLGAALMRRNGDATLADAVRAIRSSAGNTAATRRLARAHRIYAEGQDLYESKDHVGALRNFKDVVDARPPSRVLRLWAQAFLGGMQVYDMEYRQADAVFTGLLSRGDSARYPALAARIRWMWATSLLRNGKAEESRNLYGAAAREFEHLGEREYWGTTLGWSGEAAYQQGDTLAGYHIMQRGLLLLREHRNSVWRHGLLTKLAEFAVDDGMLWAAAFIQDEAVATSKRVGQPFVSAEALIARARIRGSMRQTGPALRDLDNAAVLIGKIPAPEPRKWANTALRVSRALVDPGAPHSLVVLDSAVEYFSNNKVWFLQTLLRRADARLAAGDLPGATTDLDSATAHILRLSHREADGTLRTGMMEQARTRLDQLMMLYVRAGRAREALMILERGRVSLMSPGSTEAPEKPGRLRVPQGQVAVEYALVGDTLLTWTLQDTTVRLMYQTVNRGEFLDAVKQVATLESRARAAAARPHLTRLYDWLILPVRDSLGEAETPLVILADGEIAQIPFVALWDAERGRYLLDDHPVRSAASLEDAWRPLPTADARSESALLVAPSFDAREYPSLDPLEGARAEVESLRALYPAPAVLSGDSATLAALKTRVPRASILHYAGHAVFDDAWPQRSFLVLAGAGATGRFTAEEVRGLDLEGVRLVVLSACRTLPSREGRSGGFAGLSGALLSAGAGGVVGSLWKVDDRLTQPLMLEFHRGYHRTRDPVRALWRAQLRLRHSDVPRLSSPAAWAGFRYAGS